MAFITLAESCLQSPSQTVGLKLKSPYPAQTCVRHIGQKLLIKILLESQKIWSCFVLMDTCIFTPEK